MSRWTGTKGIVASRKLVRCKENSLRGHNNGDAKLNKWGTNRKNYKMSQELGSDFGQDQTGSHLPKGPAGSLKWRQFCYKSGWVDLTSNWSCAQLNCAQTDRRWQNHYSCISNECWDISNSWLGNLSDREKLGKVQLDTESSTEIWRLRGGGVSHLRQLEPFILGQSVFSQTSTVMLIASLAFIKVGRQKINWAL